MATDPRDPRFLDEIERLDNSDEVIGGGSPMILRSRDNPRLKYDLSGALDARGMDFPARDDRLLLYDQAKNVIIPDRIRSALNDVAQDFFYKESTPLFINSGRRNSVGQAKAMYKKFSHNVRGDYAGHPLGDQVIHTYDDAVSRKLDTGQTIAAMARTIQNQVNRREYVSPHLRDSAVDIKWLENPAHRDALKEIVKDRGHGIVDEGYPVHHHVTFRIRR